jgi:hypothetical protein
MIRSTCLVLTAAALVVGAVPVAAQPAASLSISRIFHNGPLKAGANTFRVTVRNTSQTKPINPREDVLVTLLVLDAMQHQTKYEARITSGIGTSGDQTAAFPNVMLHAPGPYTVTARATTVFAAGQLNAVAPDRTEVFTVGGAQVAAGRLLVTVKNANGSFANGLRVSVRTADGQELLWKMSAGSGQADFAKVAPSPAGKPYTVLVTTGAITKATQQVQMPAQDHVLNIQLP